MYFISFFYIFYHVGSWARVVNGRRSGRTLIFFKPSSRLLQLSSTLRRTFSKSRLFTMDTDPEMPTTADGADEHVPFRTRKRRVSFAETTTIHIFDRDQTESSTPDPNSDRSDDEVEDDCEENGLFLKNIVDFSPGSTLGSATSNEGDMFSYVLFRLLGSSHFTRLRYSQ